MYRVAVASSWTGRRSANADATAKFDKRMLGMIDELISKNAFGVPRFFEGKAG